MSKQRGYTLLILVFAAFVLSIGLLVAVPIWQTQIQREKEEELIFRGNQYVEAIRLFQKKHPGSFPKSLEELVEEKCLRKLYMDPMTEGGEWNIILPVGGVSAISRSERRGSGPSVKIKREAVSSRTKGTIQKILIAPSAALPSIQNPQIIGVVSSSTKSSFKIYLGQETYDKWLFFYGLDPENFPEIVYHDEEEK